MFISRGEEGGDSGGNVGGKKEEVATEGVLKRKIAQQIAEVKEQVCSFLRHGKGGFFSQQLVGMVYAGKRILLCSCLNSGMSPNGL